MQSVIVMDINLVLICIIVAINELISAFRVLHPRSLIKKSVGV